MRDIALEIAQEEGLKFAELVRSEQDRTIQCATAADGSLLNPAPPISEEIIDNSAHIVGMMDTADRGGDRQGAGGLAGRASDTALFSTVRLMMGAGAGPAWHGQDPGVRNRLRGAAQASRQHHGRIATIISTSNRWTWT